MAVIQASPEQVAIWIRDDLDYFAALMIPDIATSPFPSFYKKVWVYILQNLHILELHQIFRFALGLPRGHAKTTFIKLLVCYLLIHDYKFNFIKVVCATEPLAENFLADIHEMMRNHVITQLYGSWDNALVRDTMKIKRAKWQGRSIILVAIGAGTSTRGLNLEHERPQLIILDDAQTKENDDSPTDRTKLLQWLIGTLFKSLTKNKKKAILYIGNMYSNECILYIFSKMRQWISLSTGGILADGTALWPEIQTVDEMLEEYEHDAAAGLGHIWFAEVQNDPIGASIGLLDLDDTIPPSVIEDYQDIDLYPHRFITVDPSGMGDNSDDSAIAVHALMEGTKVGTITINSGVWSPAEIITRALTLALDWRVGIIFVESVAFQASLAFWMTQVIMNNNLNIKVVPLPTGKSSKYTRIKRWIKLWVTGHWEVLEQRAYSKLTFQIFQYKTDKTNNKDDILDVCAQAVLAVNKHGKDIVESVVTAPTNKDEKIVLTDNSRTTALRLASSNRSGRRTA